MSTHAFELKLEGQDFNPAALSLHELADFLLAVERAVTKTAAKIDPQLDEETNLISLVGIEAGSTRLKFVSTLPVIATAVLSVSQAINTHHYAELPTATIESLRETHAYAEQRQVVIGWYATEASAPAAHKPLAEIRPEVDLNLPSVNVLRGSTVIYGKLTRIGGNPPKARLKLVSGESLSCFMSERLAKHIGGRLYEVIGLEGRAEWDLDDYSLLSFRAQGIAPYEEGTLTQAIKELGSASKNAWEGVKDVDAFIGELRGR